ncbi:uncharacterized protein GGS22DRAFT_197773 [Annulohypoxylon maeteangense]|uniref:uncharacterized protein n=1 Tax=Annulohypoxylon maeteangense TaxID=1927788 RepID=UPI002008C992|nr:uncharacterized protein GGS22DRAFT_197773 [Annulohypoxylon maeteangense]KAI0887862.1 hypothetical protein GGS22DRAFT_197773 [Annulohypoxylon maeteangense]
MPHKTIIQECSPDVEAGMYVPSAKMIKEFEYMNLPSLGDSIDTILLKSNVKFRNTIEVNPKTTDNVARHHPETRNLLRDLPYGGIGNVKDLSSFLYDQQAVVIGGAIVRNVSLVVSEEPGDGSHFGDFRVLPVQVPEGQEAKLLSKEPEADEIWTPILLFPEPYIAPPGFENFDLFEEGRDYDVVFPRVSIGPKPSRSDLEDVMLKSGMKMDVLDHYTVSGDIFDFWGVKGLTAKLYKYKGIEDEASKKRISTRDNALESSLEVISIDAQSLALGGKPLEALLPFIDSEDFKNLPIANLRLTYSEKVIQSSFQQPGLRLELDIPLQGCLDWVGDAIEILFGTSDKPHTIHFSALLSEERNWSKPPKIEKIVLQGYFKDMTFKPWNVLDFKTLGIELTAEKNEDSWEFGFGFLGVVALMGIPEAQAPLELGYRIIREMTKAKTERRVKPSRTWSLLIDVSGWKDIFGFKNFDMEEATMMALIDESHFSSSINLDVVGTIRIGDSHFEVCGSFSKGWKHALTWTWIAIESQNDVPMRLEDYYIQASLGNLALGDIKNLYTKVTGQRTLNHSQYDGDADGNITFKNMSIRISCTKYSDITHNRKSLELLGEVTVGDTTCYAASLAFATEGVTVTGDVRNVQIPGTNFFIENAGLMVFLAFKGSKGKKNDVLREGKEHHSPQVGDSSSETRSRFSIRGIMNYHNITFRAGFYTTKYKNSKGRDWLVFGSANNSRLRDAMPSIKEQSFLNLQLENVTVIVSSRDRGMSNGTSMAENKTLMGQMDTDDEANDGEHADWDALAEIEEYGYEVKKGFQICATIPRFEQLEHLNNGRKIDGLQLSLSADTDGEVTAKIKLPSSFRVNLSPYAYFSGFSASIGAHASYGMCLQLKATLTLIMENSDPIHVNGILFGTVREAGGLLVMDPNSQWINPFNLNKALIISNLGIEAGFNYATVLQLGPTRFALKGQVNIGDYKFCMDMGIDVTKAATVLRIEMPKLDMSDIFSIASKLSQDEYFAQKATQTKDIISFNDLKLYLSSGAKFMCEYYPRGVQIRGRFIFLDKQGEFNGSFTDDGLVIKGGLDAFRIGGLEITSLKEYDGKKRATLHIEATKRTHKILIDGIIRFYGIELQVYINVYLEQRLLEFDIRIKLTEALIFSVKGIITVGRSKSLENTEIHFIGHLEARIIQSIGEGIINVITALEDQANNAINEAEAQISRRLYHLNNELITMRLELEKLKSKSNNEVLRKRQKIKAQNDVLRRLHDRIDELGAKYKAAKSNKERKEAEIAEQKKKLDQAKVQLEKKKREMRQEYNQKIEEQRSRQKHYELKRDRLQQEKDRAWGDGLRKVIAASPHQDFWTEFVNERYNWKCTCERNLKSCGILQTPYWTWKLSEATLGLEQANARKAFEKQLYNATKKTLESNEFKKIERDIQNTLYDIGRFGMAVQKLIEKGPAAYIEEMTRDERAKLDRQISLYDELLRQSKRLEKELILARNALETETERLRPEQEAAREAIAELEAEIELMPFKKEYENKKQDFDTIKAQADALVSTLEDIRKGVHADADAIRQVTKMLMKGIPEITDIYLEVNSNMFAEKKPLIFSITVRWLNEDHTCRVEWSPNQGAHELYSNGARKVVALADK